MPGSSVRSNDRTLADPARIWSRADCEALYHRIVGMTTGGGETFVSARLSWMSGLRWARNRPTLSAIVRSDQVFIGRLINNVPIAIKVSKLDDSSLKQAIGDAERRVKQVPANAEREPVFLAPPQQYAQPALWSDATFHVTPQQCSEAARASVDPVMDARLIAAGYVTNRAVTWAIFNTRGLAAYAVGTGGQYSETVRAPDGTGSGWAAASYTDWSKLDMATLSARAREKCVASSQPRAIEPGRYTTILEPQAAGALMFFAVSALDRATAEAGGGPYSGAKQGETKIGERVLDERITISTDPSDPDGPYIPFDGKGYPYRPVTWIEKGVLKQLAYDSLYASRHLGTTVPQPNPNAFRMSGGPTSIEEMIATTERGILVTRFNQVDLEDFKAVLVSTSTRDGLWLVEHGRIKMPVKNMTVVESPMFIGNRVLQLGKPERIPGYSWTAESNSVDDLSNFTPEAFGNIPMIVPPMKVADFNFVSLTDAV